MSIPNVFTLARGHRSITETAREIGVSRNTWRRFELEQGDHLTETYVKIYTWLYNHQRHEVRALAYTYDPVVEFAEITGRDEFRKKIQYLPR